jgi:dihydropteroate synthase
MSISRAEITHFPKKRYLKFRNQLLDLSSPKVMGILNVTPDSFVAGSRSTRLKTLLKRTESMLESGADFIDIGSISTRPGATEISVNEELKRLIPVVKSIRTHFPECLISIDTFRSTVAAAAISEGADLINDIGGLQLNPEMIDVIAQNKTPYILMHGVKSFESMHETKENENLFRDMCFFFSEKIAILEECGVSDVILDPGFGFGKTLEQNYDVLNRLELFHLLERPLLMGISRKSMIFKKLNITPEKALNGTTCLHTVGLMKGVSIFRVHDVKEMKELIQLFT